MVQEERHYFNNLTVDDITACVFFHLFDRKILRA